MLMSRCVYWLVVVFSYMAPHLSIRDLETSAVRLCTIYMPLRTFNQLQSHTLGIWWERNRWSYPVLSYKAAMMGIISQLANTLFRMSNLVVSAVLEFAIYHFASVGVWWFVHRYTQVEYFLWAVWKQPHQLKLSIKALLLWIPFFCLVLKLYVLPCSERSESYHKYAVSTMVSRP